MTYFIWRVTRFLTRPYRRYQVQTETRRRLLAIPAVCK